MPRTGVSLLSLLLLAVIGCKENESAHVALANGGSGGGGGGGEGGSGGSTVPDCEPGFCDTCGGPPCERMGCSDGVAYDCDYDVDICVLQIWENCDARGLRCWELPEQDAEDRRFRCEAPGCGDGVLDEGEACDDGPANGVRLDACTRTCQLPPAAVLDQQFAPLAGDLVPMRYVENDHAAFQTFTASKSGRLAWIVADVSYGGLFVLEGDDYDFLGASERIYREVDGVGRPEHHFPRPVFVEAGQQYAFAVRCGDEAGCDLQVASGDRYAAGAIEFRSYPNRGPISPAPEGMDLPFETWVIEGDDGCAPENEPYCFPACGEPVANVAATCSGGVWWCGAGYVTSYDCIPRHDGPLELVGEITAGEHQVTSLVVDRSEFEPWLVLRPQANLELARIEVPGTRFETGIDRAGIRAFLGLPTDRPVTLLQSTTGYRPAGAVENVFDFVPPLVLEAGQSYTFSLDGALELAVHGDPEQDQASLQLVPWRDHTAPELPDGAVIPLRIWRTASP